VPDPTWPNHPPLLEAAGVPVGVYPYFDPATGTVAIDRMLTALRAMPRGDVVLLHGWWSDRMHLAGLAQGLRRPGFKAE
jgi:aromatic-amino-acid transaminase